MQANYFFIDGSSLTAQIRQIWRANPKFKGRKLCPLRFIDYLAGDALEDFHEREYKRATFYFPIGDETAIEEFLVIPDQRKPDLIRDIHFKFCGQKLKGSAEFNQWVEANVPEKWLNRVSKSEKGIDIQICCDAFKLATGSRIERLFLFTNDDDFIPFCHTIKEFGANISILHLSDVVNANVSLLHAADTYHVVPLPRLNSMFLPEIPEGEIQSPTADAISKAEKPDAILSEKKARTPEPGKPTKNKVKP